MRVMALFSDDDWNHLKQGLKELPQPYRSALYRLHWNELPGI
jgi:hypothetical protein